MDVHEPYMPERTSVDMVDPSITISQDEMYTLFENTLLKRDVSDPAKVSLLKRLYDVHVREVDSYVESFFKSMEILGLIKDTCVIITSDHGDEFNEHGGLSHDDKLYSELIDVPLVIYGTGETGTCTDVVSSVDIPPTILHLFGVEPPASFQGNSMLPLANHAGEGRLRRGYQPEKYERRRYKQRLILLPRGRYEAHLPGRHPAVRAI